MNSRNQISGKDWETGSWNDYCADLADLNDPVLAKQIDNHFRAFKDIADVRNDPDFAAALSDAESLISEYSGKAETATDERADYIKRSLNTLMIKPNDNNELDEARAESALINDVVSEWVSDFNKPKTQHEEEAIKARRNFITSSLYSSEDKLTGDPSRAQEKTEKKEARSRYLSRVVIFAAAAVIGAIVFIGTLTPSSDPVKIYDSYYEPFNAFSKVTRGNDQANNAYNTGIELYKSGRFAEAKDILTRKMENPYGPSTFIIGLADLETGNIKEAIDNFELLARQKGQYAKEAKWYLGLAYLRTGNKEKAKEQFEFLSASNGYYSERAGKILRRLK